MYANLTLQYKCIPFFFLIYSTKILDTENGIPIPTRNC